MLSDNVTLNMQVDLHTQAECRLMEEGLRNGVQNTKRSDRTSRLTEIADER